MKKLLLSLNLLLFFTIIAIVPKLLAGTSSVETWLTFLPSDEKIYFDRDITMYGDSNNYRINVSTDVNVIGSLTTSGGISGDFSFDAGYKVSYVVASDSTTLTASSSTVVNCTKNGVMEIVLPTASGNTGLYFKIKKTGTAGAITLTTNSTETIDGDDDPTYVDAQYDYLGIISDGTNWIVVNRYIQ